MNLCAGHNKPNDEEKRQLVRVCLLARKWCVESLNSNSERVGNDPFSNDGIQFTSKFRRRWRVWYHRPLDSCSKDKQDAIGGGDISSAATVKKEFRSWALLSTFWAIGKGSDEAIGVQVGDGAGKRRTYAAIIARSVSA